MRPIERRRLRGLMVAARALVASAGMVAIPLLAPTNAQAQSHPLCAERLRAAKDAGGDHFGVCQIIDARKAAGDAQLETGRDAVAVLAGAAADADLIVLGEVHDNPAHHALRGAVLERLAKEREAAGRPKPAVVMEHLRTDQQSALDRFTELQRDAEGKGTADALLGFLDWDATGWPPQSMFQPLFRDILSARLAIVPGDAPRDDIRNVARQGIAALDDAMRQRLKLVEPLPKPLADTLAAELKESHCGLMPEAALAPMAIAQRYRDAHLADALVKAADKAGAAALLTGNGHVRADRGVPYYLRKMAANRTLLTVMLVEVEDGKTDASTYVQRGPDGSPVSDLVVLTTRAEREDPCESLRKRMIRPKAPEKPADAPKAPTERPAGGRLVP